MRTLFFVTLTSLILLACNQTGQVSQADEAAAEEAVAEVEKMVFPEDSMSADGKMSFHGLRINETGSVSAEEMVRMATEMGGAEGIKVSAPVTAACQAKGCWMMVQTAEGDEMRVTFKDYGFFVPKDSPGKTAVMEGNVFYDTTSVDRLRHFAVDGGMSEEEAEKTITEPEVSIAFEATGVIIKEEAE